MIRRRYGEQWLLIAQNDHASLSGQLAEHIGNLRFAALEKNVILACAMHDAGWPAHDDSPALNGQGLPLDVFESPRPLALPIWAASTERAAEADSYAGLLVSLHSLCLSALPEAPPGPFESSHMRARFESNKFQHRQIEIQEELRGKLRMRTDIPLTLGLANAGFDPREDQLHFDFRWLQALDQISLGVCCTQSPFSHAGVHPFPGQRLSELRFWRDGDDLRLQPWPFDVRELLCTIRGRVVRDGAWESVEAFQQAYRVAPIERIEIRLHEG